jgi:cytochrome c-type biogenesis protein CcmE
MSAKALKIGATVAVVLLALTGLLFATLREDTQFYKHVDEVMSDPVAWQGRRLQLHGYVAGIERKRNSLEFRATVTWSRPATPASFPTRSKRERRSCSRAR